MEKSQIFSTELSYIKDDKIRLSTIYLLNKLPDYFYVIPSSSTGKYHPEYALGVGGLVRHTKAAVRIAIELFMDKVFNTFEFSVHSQDLIIMALLLHDGFKQGKVASNHTVFEHPLMAANFVFENMESLPMSKYDALQVRRLIASHMGPWNIDKTSKIVLPFPTTDEEKFVHLCDYMASRNFLNIMFVDNEIVDSVNRGQAKVLK